MSLVGVAIYTPVGEAESVRTLVSLPNYRHRAPAAAPTGMRQIPDADEQIQIDNDRYLFTLNYSYLFYLHLHSATQ